MSVDAIELPLRRPGGCGKNQMGNITPGSSQRPKKQNAAVILEPLRSVEPNPRPDGFPRKKKKT
ncbi:MAG: hypothetical protein WBV95_21245, partial [Desulfobacterales bacterium]